MAAEARAKQMIARLRKGFDNEHHWMNWRKTYDKAIAALPIHLRNAVVVAWDNSGLREKITSKASRPKAAPKARK